MTIKKRLLYYWCVLCLNIICYDIAYSQDSLKDTNPTPTSRYFEKIYLHTDRSRYFAGDDIWVKAYLVNALNNRLTKHSQTAYVELIAPDSVILQHRTIQIINGIGHGDFQLSDSILPGLYLLRAYTSYMRNFGDNFIFAKTLKIDNFILPKDTLTPVQTVNPGIDIQFFPEGGSLVQNIESQVAFKAVNAAGKGCEVSGGIFDYYGDTIVAFKSQHLGMGSFYFTPIKGMAYYAKGINENGVEFKTDLKYAIDTGVVMSVKVNPKDLFISSTNNTDSKLRLEGVLRDFKFMETSLNPDITLYSIPLENLPEGIIRLTIYNDKDLPLCERLVYIPHKENIELKITSDKKIFNQREESTIQISLSNPDSSLLNAELSLAVADEKYIRDNDKYSSTIASWFLVESEIKGDVENPAYYFDLSQPERISHLNLLLLTQGWRDFIWKYLPKVEDKLKYLPEKGFTISGKVGTRFADKPIPNALITLGISKTNQFDLIVTKTDTVGRYIFEGLNFTGENNMKLSVADEKLKKRSWIIYDTLKSNEYIFPEITLPASFVSEMKYEKTDRDSFALKIEEDALFKHRIEKEYGLFGIIPINEVVLVFDKKAEEAKKHPSTALGMPDKTLIVNPETDFVYNDIFELMRDRLLLRSKMFELGMPGFDEEVEGVEGMEFPLIIVNNFVKDVKYLRTLRIEEIYRVEVLWGGSSAFYGRAGSNGVIVVTTRKSNPQEESPIISSITTKVKGYYEARVFYVPDYTKHIPEHEKPDLRTTVYWKPDIQIRDSKPVQVKYFNADIPATMVIDVQGITYSGVPVTGKAIYEVK